MKTIVTKAQFAALKGRRPSSVSNWIAEGKISRDALIGDGVRARIWLEQAERDLVVSLDPAQQAAQATPVTVSTPAVAASSARESEPYLRLPAVTSNADDEDIRRRRKADADRAEHDAEAARRKLAIDEGRWIDAAEAARTWGRELAKLNSEIETFLANALTRELAQRHNLDWKALSVEVRELYRSYRSTASDDARERRQAAEDASAETTE